MPERADDQPDVNPALVATDPLLSEIAHLVAYLDLHLGRYQWSQLTTRQKELLADLVDASSVIAAADDPGYGEPARTTRWWRESYDGPPVQRGFDPDLDDGSRREPDPFLYVDETHTAAVDAARAGECGVRRRLAPVPVEGASAVSSVARGALLGLRFDRSDPAHVHLDEITAALHARITRSVLPLRRTAGDDAGSIGAMVRYPSLNQAKAMRDEIVAEVLARHADPANRWGA